MKLHSLPDKTHMTSPKYFAKLILSSLEHKVATPYTINHKQHSRFNLSRLDLLDKNERHVNIKIEILFTLSFYLIYSLNFFYPLGLTPIYFFRQRIIIDVKFY